MATTRTIILDLGKHEAASSDIVVSAGERVTITMYANEPIQQGVQCLIFQKTAGKEQVIAYLSLRNGLQYNLQATGTYFVKRYSSLQVIGVQTER